MGKTQAVLPALSVFLFGRKCEGKRPSPEAGAAVTGASSEETRSQSKVITAKQTSLVCSCCLAALASPQPDRTFPKLLHQFLKLSADRRADR